MGLAAHDDVLDDGLDSMDTAVTANGKLVVCEGQPTTYSHASQNKGTGDGMALATQTGSLTLTVADGTTGRKVTVAAVNGISVAVTGGADHVALIDTVTGGGKLWLVTTATLKTLTAGDTVNVPEWVFTIKDPTAPA